MSAPRALLSVSDKTGIVELARGLAERGWEILSTGGTARAIREGGVEVTEVSEITGHPEMMEGRVKTLHPAVHAGLLARRGRPDDLDALEAHGYRPIDLVAVNLYPFRETVARGGVPVGEAMEQVDIGGPTMLRSAAKNHADVWVVVDPADYGRVLEAVRAAEGAGAGGAGAGDSASLRRRLAAKVFGHTSAYDRAVSAYLTGQGTEGRGDETRTGDKAADEGRGREGDAGAGPIPSGLEIGLRRDRTLRYGENPDQEAGFYVPRTGTEEELRTGLAALRQLHGKELSYNNLLDLDGALLSLSPFAASRRPVCAIIKHTTPCGLAAGDDLEQAYRRALRTDPVSAFGSVIAVNRRVDRAAAEALDELFVECLVAPGFDEDALEVLTRKKNVRLLEMPEGDILIPHPDPGGIEASPWWAEEGADDARAAAAFLLGQSAYGALPSLRSVYGGMLAQAPPAPPHYTADGRVPKGWSVPTEREPTPEEWDDLRFAWAAVFGVKSNAILLAAGAATLGIGAGQMSRVDASRIAVMKAGDAGLDLDGSALASDAFFPFRDGVDAAAEAGVRAIVQPGGSRRDEEVVAAADEHGIAMVMTGRRLFRH